MYPLLPSPGLVQKQQIFDKCARPLLAIFVTCARAVRTVVSLSLDLFPYITRPCDPRISRAHQSHHTLTRYHLAIFRSHFPNSCTQPSYRIDTLFLPFGTPNCVAPSQAHVDTRAEPGVIRRVVALDHSRECGPL